MKLRISSLAENDIESIGDYIAKDSPRRALTFVKELRNQCKKIAESPLIYRLRPELSDNIRACIYRKYIIFFQCNDNEVFIVSVLHGAMDLKTRLQEKD
jgi:toxin ParE1/3/4